MPDVMEDDREETPQEPCAYDLLGWSSPAARRLLRMWSCARRHRLRECRDCGTDFRGGGYDGGRFARCATCRAIRRGDAPPRFPR